MNDQLASLVAQLKERRALTFQERIKSLDIRDEIWRKYIELNKGSSFDAIAAQRTGLSPDMCCERERLTREFQRLLNPYEFDPDTRALNHSLMITQYSRASADQAMPSAYDLRSGPALLHTMNYLITNIMDKFDQEREQSDWYNFLWDRLRAIRKELTQQHLRDEIAIEILEQCARFHIFCSAFLSEYSRDSFDPNLNEKMLIDCLNQLRECYLTHKQQNNMQSLRNIAEFSSYMLLINLKDDNETLLRIRRLIQDITQVSEVKIALNIHRSLLLNNTTKFFSLIDNEATLLQSCLLQRYFTIIRLKRLNSLNSSIRNTDEFRLSDLTDILGMDNDDETRDYLEQLGYSISNSNPPCIIISSTDNQIQQQPINKLSYKLVRSKYKGNLKDIITGSRDTPVIIPDTNIEDSFDLQGCFVGKLPFDTDGLNQMMSRRPPPPPPTFEPQQQQQHRSQLPLIPRRPPSESALRSMASTTTANTFTLIRSRPISSANLFASATTTITTPALTTASSPFRFDGFTSNRTPTSQPTSTLNPFTQPVLQTRIFSSSTQQYPSTSKSLFSSEIQRPRDTQRILSPAEPILAPAQIPKPSLRVTEPTIQLPPPPPPPPVARRLSTNSIDVFADELYEQMVDPFIRETTYTIFDELISQWNNLTSQTVTIFNEFIFDEINSVANEYYNDFEFQQKMLRDTLNEENERKRKKYLTKKYFFIWFENSFQAQEERFILQELQLKYHFLNNEQLLEFLTGIQLITEHDLTLEQTTNILKSRRYLKKSHLKRILLLSNLFFEEFLQEELHSIVIESNQEVNLREKLLENSLKKQFRQRREHYLQLKYYSLWILHYRQRKQNLKRQLLLNTNNKRLNQFLQLRSNKKLKENNQQYNIIKNSFDQLTTDLNQIQLFIDKLNS
ncbi:unnamed protein product [Adineta steineri]|uniref:SAC3/GANP/THP3 conserved domain-containing protein n=1 Tax=Adineta steineri TaxID=433720 RepID=A0A815RYU9_9BILA|nr:unnamed protein product [Adineta steineri]CAF1483753.1 unnamed protein product [Adineta steineri]CAF1516642.1 unnamed protein product [Adineta steineri]CAF1639306.1 unnamed protein product [Adineta steineri]